MTGFWLKWLIALSLTLGLGLGGAACGGDGEPLVAGSCDMLGVICVEYVGSSFDSTSIQTQCAEIGTFSLGPCYAGGALGKCSHSVETEFEQATYYYLGIAETLKTDCENAGGIWTPLS